MSLWLREWVLCFQNAYELLWAGRKNRALGTTNLWIVTDAP